ncbi:MAG: DUF547 domain-containing protein [Acidobacteriota bacterium]|nr:DUF547 domain-containing protein [Acidobacteriota bacterium]
MRTAVVEPTLDGSLRSFAVLLLAVCLSSPACGAGDVGAVTGSLPSHENWGRVLEQFQHDGGLDYAGLQAQPQELDAYLSALSEAHVAGASREEQLAFWINAYNAVVARFVVDLYPGVTSVKEVDGFFDGRAVRVAGEELTLDEIEGRALALSEPRVHFAVVCASHSCPDLLHEAYDAVRLEEQLDTQTRAFLANREKGSLYDEDATALSLSPIFKWYAGDFTGGSTVVAFFLRSKVLEWVIPYLSEGVSDRIQSADVTVRYFEYDWSLNDRPRP